MEKSRTEFPAGVRLGNESLIRVTDAARDKLASLRVKENLAPFLRIKVTGGGCSGLSYKLKFLNEACSGDIAVSAGTLYLLIDSKSALYLKGMTLDYSDRLVAGGFKFQNPNAKSSCSCGESFAV